MPLYLTGIEGPPPKCLVTYHRAGKFPRKTKYTPLYLRWIEGPPPKRNAGSSSLPRGAKTLQFQWIAAFLFFVKGFS